MNIESYQSELHAMIVEPDKCLLGIAHSPIADHAEIIKKHFSIRTSFLSLRKELAMVNAHIKNEQTGPVRFALLHKSDRVLTIALIGSFRALLYFPNTEDPVIYTHTRPESSSLNGKSDSIFQVQYHTFEYTHLDKIVLENPSTEQRLTFTFSRI